MLVLTFRYIFDWSLNPCFEGERRAKSVMRKWNLERCVLILVLKEKGGPVGVQQASASVYKS